MNGRFKYPNTSAALDFLIFYLFIIFIYVLFAEMADSYGPLELGHIM
jgi:hypothetical protein